VPKADLWFGIEIFYLEKGFLPESMLVFLPAE
jgi:hypothetical protein